MNKILIQCLQVYKYISHYDLKIMIVRFLYIQMSVLIK